MGLGLAARCRMQFGDTADFKSALPLLAARTVSRCTLFPKKPENPAGRQISLKSLILNPYEPFQPIFVGLKTAVEPFDGYQKLILGGVEQPGLP